MVELDIQKGTVRGAGSHTRNLLRVKRGIDMVKVLFEQILATEYVHSGVTSVMLSTPDFAALVCLFRNVHVVSVSGATP